MCTQSVPVTLVLFCSVSQKECYLHFRQNKSSLAGLSHVLQDFKNHWPLPVIDRIKYITPPDPTTPCYEPNPRTALTSGTVRTSEVSFTNHKAGTVLFLCFLILIMSWNIFPGISCCLQRNGLHQAIPKLSL